MQAVTLAHALGWLVIAGLVLGVLGIIGLFSKRAIHDIAKKLGPENKREWMALEQFHDEEFIRQFGPLDGLRSIVDGPTDYSGIQRQPMMSNEEFLPYDWADWRDDDDDDDDDDEPTTTNEEPGQS